MSKSIALSTSAAIYKHVLELFHPADVMKMSSDSVQPMVDAFKAADAEMKPAIASRLLYLLSTDWNTESWDDDAQTTLLRTLVELGATLTTITVIGDVQPSVYDILSTNKQDIGQFFRFMYSHAPEAARGSMRRQLKASATDEQFAEDFREYTKIIRVLSACEFTGTEIHELVIAGTTELAPVQSLLLKSKKLLESISKKELVEMIRLMANAE